MTEQTPTLSCLSRVKRNGTERPPASLTYTDIAVVFDRSGSMHWKMPHVCEGFTEFIDKMQKEQKDESSVIKFTMVPFSTTREEAFINAQDINTIPSFNHNQYPFMTGGSTQLYDTAIDVLKEQKERCNNSEVSTWKKIFVIVTDGIDNRSRRNIIDFNTTIKNAREEGTVCIFLGADQDAVRTGQSYGFSSEQSLTFDGLGAAHAMGSALSGMAIDSIRGNAVGFTPLQREASQGTQNNHVHFDLSGNIQDTQDTQDMGGTYSPTPDSPMLQTLPRNFQLPPPPPPPPLVRNETSVVTDSVDTVNM